VRLDLLLDYLGVALNNGDILEELSDNWKQVIGGKMSVRMKKEKGTYKLQLKKCQESSSKYMIALHKKMKKENPEKYHLMQYEKFKKIGGYKFLTLNGERVRNQFEKDIADLFRNLGITYKYEPLVRVGNKYFFPDFLINNNTIIECTAWRGFDKAIKLNDKIKHLKKKYKVFVVVPKPLKRYYETINYCLISGIDDFEQFLKKS